MKRLLLSLFFLIALVTTSPAQCAMCRSTLENGYSSGQPGLASSINTGIFYLLVLPYLAAVVIGYLWYKTSKHGRQDFDERTA